MTTSTMSQFDQVRTQQALADIAECEKQLKNLRASVKMGNLDHEGRIHVEADIAYFEMRLDSARGMLPKA